MHAEVVALVGMGIIGMPGYGSSNTKAHHLLEPFVNITKCTGLFVIL